MRLRLPAVAACLLALAAAERSGPAEAHAILLSSRPAAGATLPAGRTPLSLRFNSRIDKARSLLRLTKPDGTEETLAIAPDGLPDELRTVADLVPGPSRIGWQVLAVDGHITRGAFTLTASGR